MGQIWYSALFKSEVIAQLTIRFKCVRNKVAQLTDPARQMCTDKADELIARIGMDPHTVLQSDKSSTHQQITKLRPHPSALLSDIKEQYAPPAVPSHRLRNLIFAHEYAFDMSTTLIGKLDPAVALADQSTLFEASRCGGDPLIQFLAVYLSSVEL